MRKFLRRPLFLGATALGAFAIVLTLPSSAEAGGGCRGTPVTVAAGETVEMRGLCFFPTVLEVATGQTVTWSNRESAPHTVTGANATWGDYTELEMDESVSRTFDTAGVYPYYCFVHPGMIGAIVVRGDDDAASTPGAAGSSATGDDAGYPGAGYALIGALAGILITGTSVAVVRRR